METLAARWLESIQGLGGLEIPLYILIFIVSTFLLVPVVLPIASGGILFGFPMGALLASLSATLTAFLNFLVGRYWIRERISQKICRSPKLQALDRAVKVEGWKVVGLSRITAIAPFVLMNLFWGATRVSWKSYLFATWIAMLPGILFFVYLGAAATDATVVIHQKGSFGFFLLGLAAAVGIFVLLTIRVKKILRGGNYDASGETCRTVR